jgi:hypothetical protein
MTPVPRTIRSRLCARPDCPVRFDSFGAAKTHWPAKYCSPLCHLLDTVKPSAPAPRQQIPRTAAKRPASAVSVASPAQRAVAANGLCIVCGEPGCDPAHLIDRSLADDGNGDPRAVVALCRRHHREYDECGLSLLEHLEPHGRVALAFAVERHGLIRTLERVTNSRWVPQIAPAPQPLTDEAA